MDDMLILIIYPLRLNLVHFARNWHTKCKKVLIPIYYNGHTVKIALIQYTLFDDVIMTSRRETQMGDQVVFISYPLKFDLV